MWNLDRAPDAIDYCRQMPLARYFEGVGETSFRSGCDRDDTFALFVAGGPHAVHRQLDALHFTIYKMGYLAIDTGAREDGRVHHVGWYNQTVAHNSILIDMPGEPETSCWGYPPQRQNGGQYRYKGSKVISFETNRDYAYVAADGTRSYLPEKCSQAIRQFLFIPPGYFVVFDRVTSLRAEYRKTWLFHSINEPSVDGTLFRVDEGRGRLLARSFLPKKAKIEKIGGAGHEYYYRPYYAAGINYTGDSSGYKGKWHIEVHPGSPRKTDYFLHLIQVGDQKLKAMDEAEFSESASCAKLRFHAGERDVSVRFAKTGHVGGHIRIVEKNRTIVDRYLTDHVQQQSDLDTRTSHKASAGCTCASPDSSSALWLVFFGLLYLLMCKHRCSPR